MAISCAYPAVACNAQLAGCASVDGLDGTTLELLCAMVAICLSAMCYAAAEVTAARTGTMKSTTIMAQAVTGMVRMESIAMRLWAWGASVHAASDSAHRCVWIAYALKLLVMCAGISGNTLGRLVIRHTPIPSTLNGRSTGSTVVLPKGAPENSL